MHSYYFFNLGGLTSFLRFDGDKQKKMMSIAELNTFTANAPIGKMIAVEGIVTVREHF